MGYSVGEADGRFIGYGVVAECDHPDCHTIINRGMGYQCREISLYDDDDNVFEDEGCGLYFCDEHLFNHPEDGTIVPKGDHPFWMYFVLHHPSWSRWREENPSRVEEFQKVLSDETLRREAEEYTKGEFDDEEEGEEAAGRA